MITNIIREHVQTMKRVENWQEAIRKAAIPLLQIGAINEQYIEAMIHNVEVNGPYIVIMPDVAMPHSRVEDGAFSTATSLLKLEEGVLFPKEKEVHLIIVLAASDNDTHMQLLSDMVDLFMDEENMEKLLKTNSKDEIEAILA